MPRMPIMPSPPKAHKDYVPLEQNASAEEPAQIVHRAMLPPHVDLVPGDGTEAAERDRVRSVPCPHFLPRSCGCRKASGQDLITEKLALDLRDRSMRAHHWEQLSSMIGKQVTAADLDSPAGLRSLGLHGFKEEVAEIVSRAQKEQKIEETLAQVTEKWSRLKLKYIPHKHTETMLIHLTEELVEVLDDHQLRLQSCCKSRLLVGNASLREAVEQWQNKLAAVDLTIRVAWQTVQQKWLALEPCFESTALREQERDAASIFDRIDENWKELMKEAATISDPIEIAQRNGRQGQLDDMLKSLEQCERSVKSYLETKKSAFPRFYFVSTADLLDMYSEARSPCLCQRHFSKMFEAIDQVHFESTGSNTASNIALGIIDATKEFLRFSKPLECDRPVEEWLKGILEETRACLKLGLTDSLQTYKDKPRHEWAMDHCAQLVVLASRIVYTEGVNQKFKLVGDGIDNALKDLYDKTQAQLAELSKRVYFDNYKDPNEDSLSVGDRTKITTLVTIDVHARDVISKLIDACAESAACFEWQSQLRYRIEEQDCWINICFHSTKYSYEYIGNCGTLVITPLTDRCYITLTQAARLTLGGAATGKTATGKMSTVKDLGRALGIMVYVVNCGGQMDYRAMAHLFKGFAQTGCWGYFKEFDRIDIEVLSVCSAQYVVVLQGIRGGVQEIEFEGERIPILKSCMAFITMTDPSCAGRKALPQSLSALFRPVPMMMPDTALITEITLFSEGFKHSKDLASKVVLCHKLWEDRLSKADHYDWRLTAIKALLRVAVSIKRKIPELSEAKVLVRALRDATIDKLSCSDVAIFQSLLNDVFPNTLEFVPPARDLDFERAIKECSAEKGLQAEDIFVRKITQLRAMFVVRWSVFLLGVPGTGKTRTWQTLMDSQNKFGEQSTATTLNPKAVTCNELYGYSSTSKCEWKDGLLSQIFRDYSKNDHFEHQWIVLDGDVDAGWIETMNTVMSDTKRLTLRKKNFASESIPLTRSMRLLFEVGCLRNLSPATLVRAGVIYFNEDDIGWMPFVSTWLDSRPGTRHKEHLMTLVDKYVQRTLTAIKKQFKNSVPKVDISGVMTMCHILDGLLGAGDDAREKSLVSDSSKEGVVEKYFVWACVWAFGGGLHVDKSKNHREHFSRWWIENNTTVEFPVGLTVFDVKVDEKGDTLVPWDCAKYVHTPGVPIHDLFVDVPETARLTYLFNLLVKNRHGVMYCGNAGTGKTMCMRNDIKNLAIKEEFIYSFITLNTFTDSITLQTIMEEQLEKKGPGITFGPPGKSRLIYYIDDLNMPVVDKYNTQQPIAFLRCFVEYELAYEREKLGPRKVKNCDIVTSMNPSAGRTIDGRFQRQFATFSCQLPPASSLEIIYGSILDAHLADFDSAVVAVSKAVVAAACQLQAAVAHTFMPSVTKFHYIFNLRCISAVFRGLLRSERWFCRTPRELVDLMIHEQNRVYHDRLIAEEDRRRYDTLLKEVCVQNFAGIEGCDKAKWWKKSPLIFTDFCCMEPCTAKEEVEKFETRKPYLAVKDWRQLSDALEYQLEKYNETIGSMNLVLFKDAMEYVARISRIIGQRGGNALLVGASGNGKKSLARLAACINGYEVYQVKISAAYNLAAFKKDLSDVYKRTGCKSIGTLFLFTDQQIVDEKCLALLNDMLSSGDIPGLFSEQEMEDICNSVRPEVQQAGIDDTRDTCWDFFIGKTRKFLHTVLCFSPVGDTFRARTRQFPALLHGTTIVWFHAWSKETLESVAMRFLGDMANVDEDLQKRLANHMAHVHMSVASGSVRYRESLRRVSYVTPKSFLEMIALYKTMLGEKLEENDSLKKRLNEGLAKVLTTSNEAEKICKRLKEAEMVVKEKQDAVKDLQARIESDRLDAEEHRAALATAVDETAKEAELAKLQEHCQEATTEMDRWIAAAAETKARAAVATRLVDGLSSNDARWTARIKNVDVRQRTLIGDVLLASAFVSYAGPFTAQYRSELVRVQWLPDMIKREIPVQSLDYHPLAFERLLAVLPERAADVLATEPQILGWGGEGLPSDTVSVQNGAIIHNCKRWPLLIDPQLQGINWLKGRTADPSRSLNVVQLTQANYMQRVEAAMTNGECIVIENMGESIDRVLAPVLARAVIKRERGFIINFGDNEVDYDSKFQLYLQTKLANPHYNPEVQTQCTLVNFAVTEKGLEDQLLALVMLNECPDLEEKRSKLIRAENDFKKKLKDLEDKLLKELASSVGDILDNTELIKILEETNTTELESQKKVAENKQAAVEIDTAHEVYRPVAVRGSLMYFVVDKLNNLSHMYQFSMANYVDIFKQGMQLTPRNGDSVKKRIDSMVDASCFQIFSYVALGLFERHKLIFASQLSFQIEMRKGLVDPKALVFLLRAPQELGTTNPCKCKEWLSDEYWAYCLELENLEQFGGLTADLADSAKWREWSEEPCAETSPLPGDWNKKLSAFDRLLVIRAIRPDRMAEALTVFVTNCIGEEYTTSQPLDLYNSFKDSRPAVPILVFSSPGADVRGEVIALWRKMCPEDPAGAVSIPLSTISLGQGQEHRTVGMITKAHKEGGWVVLQNIHLAPGFCKRDLEPRLDKIANPHKHFRLVLVAEPSNEIPIPVLQACLKLTTEPPDGLKVNIKRAVNSCPDDALKNMQPTAQQLVFALCCFHAMLLQRRKFGSIGFTSVCPFSTSDLEGSVQMCLDHLNAVTVTAAETELQAPETPQQKSTGVPLAAVRYMIGEVMYGGRIFNDWDRRLVNTYLESMMHDDLLNQEDMMELFPGFCVAQPDDSNDDDKDHVSFLRDRWRTHIDKTCPSESPACYGLHANAEIGFCLSKGREMSSMLAAFGAAGTQAGGSVAHLSVEGNLSVEGIKSKAKDNLDYILVKLPDAYDKVGIGKKLAGQCTPFTTFFLQEIERMNSLLAEMKASLNQLNRGLKGDLTISDAMEVTMRCLYSETIPPSWEKKSYPTLRSLGPWFMDVLQRCEQLTDWTRELVVPAVSWFPGFFSPQSFLTAVRQTTARRHKWPLDKTVLHTEVTSNRSPNKMLPGEEPVARNMLRESGGGREAEEKVEELCATLGLAWTCSYEHPCLDATLLNIASQTSAELLLTETVQQELVAYRNWKAKPPASEPQLFMTEGKVDRADGIGLDEIEARWATMEFSFANYGRGPLWLTNVLDVLEAVAVTKLELQSVRSSNSVAVLTGRTNNWVSKMYTVEEIIGQWVTVQTLWTQIGVVLSGDDGRLQVPQDIKTKFARCDKSWVKIMTYAYEKRNVIRCCCSTKLLQNTLPSLNEALTSIHKDDGLQQLARKEESIKRVGKEMIAKAWTRTDINMQTPLHKLCANPYISAELATEVNRLVPISCWSAKDNKGRTPLHVLCSNQSAEPHRLENFLAALKIPADAWSDSSTGSTAESLSTPMHLLLMRQHLTPTLLDRNVGRSGWLNANSADSEHSALSYLCKHRSDQLTSEILTVVAEQVGVRSFIDGPVDEQKQDADPKGTLLYGLMRKLDADDKYAEWFMSEGFWKESSACNPLACAYASPPKAEWAEKIVHKLVKSKVLHRVHGLIDNIQTLLEMGGSFARAAVHLISVGGVLDVEMAQDFAIPPLDPSKAGPHNDGFQGHEECHDVLAKYLHRSDDALGWFTPREKDVALGECIQVQIVDEGDIQLRNFMRVCLKDVGQSEGLRESRCKYCGHTHTGKCGYILQVPSKAVQSGPSARNYADVQLHGEVKARHTCKLTVDTTIGLIAPAWGKLLDGQEHADATPVKGQPDQSGRVVSPALIAIAGAAACGDSGLLGMLLQVDEGSSGPIDIEVFGSEAVKKLIEFKWGRFGRCLFGVDVGLHMTLVAVWQYVAFFDSRTSGAFLPEAHRTGFAVGLCIIGGCSPYIFYAKHLATPAPAAAAAAAAAPAAARALSATAAATVTTRTATILFLLAVLTIASVLLGAVYNPTNAFAMVLLIALTARMCLKEIIEIQQGTVRYLSGQAGMWNLADVLSISLMIVVICRVLFHAHRDVTTQMSAVATTLLWFRSIKHLSGASESARYVQMFLQIMSDIKFFILMLVIFWIGNFFSLLLLYPVALLDTEDDSNTTNSAQARSIWRLHANDHESVEHTFGSLFRTFFASMNMMFGQFDLEVIEMALSPTLMTLIYIYFSWMVPIIMMNLLIAMMGGSYERVEESAVNEGLRKRAELIVEFEKSPIYRADLFYLMRSSHVDEDFYPPWLYFFRDAGATEGTANHRDNGVINGVSRLVRPMDTRFESIEQQFKESRKEANALSAKLDVMQAQLQEFGTTGQLPRTNDHSADSMTCSSEATHEKAPDGQLIYGLHLEGCRWDDEIGGLAESNPRRLYAPMPVIHIQVTTDDAKPTCKESYACPVYKTKMRAKGALGRPDGGYIFTANLSTKEPVSKWTKAGVALLVDISG